MSQKWTVKKLVEEYGAKNVRFYLPMNPLEFAGLIPGIAFTSSNSPKQVVECEIYEGRYKISENYKIELRAVNRVYGKESWYIMDLDTALRYQDSRIRVYILHGDGYTQVPNSDFRY
jgi:hypothetical protein